MTERRLNTPPVIPMPEWMRRAALEASLARQQQNETDFIALMEGLQRMAVMPVYDIDRRRLRDDWPELAALLDRLRVISTR